MQRERAAPPRMRDVAQAAGLSIATVSRALSGSRGVKQEHYLRVLDAAQRLDYKPDRIAQSLRMARTGTIGIVVPSIDNPFFPSLITAAERELAVEGRALIISFTSDDVTSETDRVRTLVDRRVDGLLVSATSYRRSAPGLQRVLESTPMVLFDQKARGVQAPFIGTDDGQGMRLIVDHLAGCGAVRLAYIGAADDNWSGYRRRRAFERLVESTDGLELAGVRAGAFSRQHGVEAAKHLLSLSRPVDAIVCGNDLIAAGVIDVAYQAGLRVPEDLLVTGYDDIEVATMCRPALTTVRQPVDAMMRHAVQTLLAFDDVRGLPDKEFPVDLVIRASTVRAAT